MRVPIKKFLFIGSKQAHETFFERAQRIGWFEFISVSGQKPHLFPKPVEDLKNAIKILKKQPVKEPQAELERYKAHDMVDRIVALKQEIEKLLEERRLLQAEIVKVHPLGEFDVADIDFLKSATKKVFQFVFIRHERLKREDIPKELIFIKREFDFDYYLYIGVQKFSHQAFTEVYVRKALSQLMIEKGHLIEALHERERELKECTAYQKFLEEFFLEELSRLNLDFAKGDVDYYLDEGVFGIEAWVPENKEYAIKTLVEDLPILVSQVALEKADVVPTHLENTGIARIGQDLVEIYDTPSTSDKDPSMWIVCSFALFFGMIISDAGYGVIFLALAGYIWFRFPKLKGIKQRMLKLATILSCTTLVWGILISSYFSIRFEPSSPVYKTSILHHLALHKIGYHLNLQDSAYHEWVKEYPKIASAKTPLEVLESGTRVQSGHVIYKFMNDMSENLFLEIAILVGIIHLSFSFFRNLYRNWSGFGWVVAMWGAYLFFPKVVNAVSLVQYLHWMQPYNTCYMGQQLLYGGLALALILAVIQQGISGVTSMFKIIEVFADTLSYLRIYALGLASMVMASTFNDMGEMVGGGLLGALVIAFGHTINIGLGTMAGTLHGLRLNFLEWYHHSFEGGGKKFRPLRIFIKE